MPVARLADLDTIDPQTHEGLSPDLAPVSALPTLYGVFARADHPSGYGYPDGRAHGYVTLFVGCDDAEQLLEVAARLTRPFLGPPNVATYSEGRLGEWYGGTFQFIATVEQPRLCGLGRFQSLGDNCYAGIFSAAEVLADA
jgi:hypothetical protein